MSAARQCVVASVAAFGWLAVACHLLGGCAAFEPAMRESTPCDPVTLATLTARCVAEARACDPLPAACPAEDACMQKLDERQTTCLERGAP